MAPLIKVCEVHCKDDCMDVGLLHGATLASKDAGSEIVLQGSDKGGFIASGAVKSKEEDVAGAPLKRLKVDREDATPSPTAEAINIMPGLPCDREHFTLLCARLDDQRIPDMAWAWIKQKYLEKTGKNTLRCTVALGSLSRLELSNAIEFLETGDELALAR